MPNTVRNFVLAVRKLVVRLVGALQRLDKVQKLFRPLGQIARSLLRNCRLSGPGARVFLRRELVVIDSPPTVENRQEGARNRSDVVICLQSSSEASAASGGKWPGSVPADPGCA